VEEPVSTPKKVVRTTTTAAKRAAEPPKKQSTLDSLFMDTMKLQAVKEVKKQKKSAAT
jgi:hypothetical protein